jgi:hypothetical protein
MICNNTSNKRHCVVSKNRSITIEPGESFITESDWKEIVENIWGKKLIEAGILKEEIELEQKLEPTSKQKQRKKDETW